MVDIEQYCEICNKTFIINEWEQNFLKEMGIPIPTICISHRHQIRLAHRNEQSIYRGKCHKTNKSIISMYSPDKPYKVYCPEAWWGDDWDAKDYGKDFDFSRPFFEQFKELQLEVPRISLFNTKAENSDYCNLTTSSKNCYLCFGGDINEDCMYSTFTFNCKDCYDSYWLNKCVLCYECIDCNNCFNVKYSQFTQESRDSQFLFDCRNCSNCVGCVGLRNKEFHILNIPYSKEEYEAKLNKLKLNNWTEIEKFKKEFNEFKLKFPHRNVKMFNTEDCTGNTIKNAKNCENCFDIDGPARDLKDCLICGLNINDMISCNHTAMSEFMYETMSGVSSYNCAFSTYGWSSPNSWYCEMVNNSQDLFGCTNMKREKFCILNKQYSESEYYSLRTKIIEHMKKTGEFGNFFPGTMSVFGYNETIAQTYFPLTKEQAISQNFNWSDYQSPAPKADKNLPAERLPDTIAEIPNEILNWAIKTNDSSKPFKINAKELNFYREHNIPIPHINSEDRYVKRMSQRTPIQLWERQCSKCNTEIKTSYSKNRKEIVYCENCYAKEIY
jgi:hypothetical protein